MRYPYAPTDRYSPHIMPINDCGNAGHIDAYLWYAHDARRLKALQVMRDYGLLPHTHLQLAHLRRAYHASLAEEASFRDKAYENYKAHWSAYREAKYRTQEIYNTAVMLYNEMFRLPAWQVHRVVPCWSETFDPARDHNRYPRFTMVHQAEMKQLSFMEDENQ